MNQRFVWNFEFTSSTGPLPPEALVAQEKEPLKWEIRFFWPAEQIITLNPIDKGLLDLTNYQQKQKEDYYFLLPGSDDNIKRRQNELYYKPLVQRSNHALGFGTKIKIDALPQSHEQDGTEVYVKKEALVYKFPTKPAIKLELARLEILDKIYFSACIEGKSQTLVEKITERLLGKHVSCEYVTFLKKILPS